jgi:1,4-alpha-glucan branching enzyme
LGPAADESDQMLKFTNSREHEVVKITFSLPASDCDQPVSVLGDFNGWNPYAHPLRKRSNGMRSTTIEVEAGQTIRFKYLDADGNWFCDPDTGTAVHHEYQTMDSLLVV